MQNIGNEEHTRGNVGDLPLRVGGVHVEPRARCQLLGNSDVMRATDPAETDALSESGHRLGHARARRSSES